MLCYAMLCYAIPYHTIPYHTIPYHTIPLDCWLWAPAPPPSGIHLRRKGHGAGFRPDIIFWPSRGFQHEGQEDAALLPHPQRQPRRSAPAQPSQAQPSPAQPSPGPNLGPSSGPRQAWAKAQAVSRTLAQSQDQHSIIILIIIIIIIINNNNIIIIGIISPRQATAS